MTIRSSLMNLLPNRNGKNPTSVDYFSALQDEIEQVFENFGRSMPASIASLGTTFPRCEMAQADGKVEIKADLPGIEPKDIELSVEGDTVLLKAERKSTTKDDDKRWTEISYGSIERAFTLPFVVDAGKIGADFKNGQLTITVPVPKGTIPERKKIEVKAAN